MQDGCSFVYHTVVPAAASIWNAELATSLGIGTAITADVLPTQLYKLSISVNWINLVNRGDLVCMNNLTFDLFLAMEYELHNYIGHENIAKEAAHKKKIVRMFLFCGALFLPKTTSFRSLNSVVTS